MKRHLKPIRATNPLVIAACKVIEADGRTHSEITAIAGLNHNELSMWRAGDREPKLSRLMWALEAIGMQLTVTPKEPEK